MTQAGAAILVEDDPDVRAATAQTLTLAGFLVRAHASGLAALADIDPRLDGIVVTDLLLPRLDGRELFQRIRAIDSGLPVIFITGHGEIGDAVETMREGAYDFLTKPFSADRLATTAMRALEQRRLVLENRRLRAEALETSEEAPLIGPSIAIAQLRERLRTVAAAEVDVLFEGEPGSGKEAAARTLHRYSRRARRPFAPLRCAASSPQALDAELFGEEETARRRITKLEAADGGALFVDDIDLMPDTLQARLVRALEDRELIGRWASAPRVIDVRLLAAATGDALAHVAEGRLRQDLFYRVGAARIAVPPLRARLDDVPVLFVHLLEQAARRFGRDPPDLDSALKTRLLAHDWPGNVRELQSFAEQVALGLADPGQVSDAASRQGLRARVDQFEAAQIRDALRASRGDVRLAMIALHLPKKTFYEKVKRHGIELREFRGG